MGDRKRRKSDNNGGVTTKEKLKGKEYDAELERLHSELVKLQEWVKSTGHRMVVIFDRSWYNRAGVERVMGFCTETDVKKFLRAVPLVEKAIVDSGVHLIKFWLEVSQEEQTRRLESRIDDGRKIWKLSGMDLLSYGRWYDYSRARDDMFKASDTDYAPWIVVPSDDKRRARLNIIAHILDAIPYKEAPREKVKLPERQKPGGYKEPDYPYKYVEERY